MIVQGCYSEKTQKKVAFGQTRMQQKPAMQMSVQSALSRVALACLRKEEPTVAEEWTNSIVLLRFLL
jgi:hypothetical protein